MLEKANQELPEKSLELTNAREIDDILRILENAVKPNTGADSSRNSIEANSSVFEEFRSQYKEFLQILLSLTQNNLAPALKFGRELREKLPLEPEPTEQQKLSLKGETEETLLQAKSTLADLIDRKQSEVDALLKMINDANKALGDENILRTGESRVLLSI